MLRQSRARVEIATTIFARNAHKKNDFGEKGNRKIRFLKITTKVVKSFCDNSPFPSSFEVQRLVLRTSSCQVPHHPSVRPLPENRSLLTQLLFHPGISSRATYAPPVSPASSLPPPIASSCTNPFRRDESCCERTLVARKLLLANPVDVSPGSFPRRIAARTTRLSEVFQRQTQRALRRFVLLPAQASEQDEAGSEDRQGRP